ncbi:macrolide transporter subunit MacA [uncultured Roseburia sp.]|uniref:Biotin/lipoyl-binding protein n=1 Tax=Brotonthovivens ammoniilytica TaxID=2981725 RepID=A0ABT2TKM0_9FIRM|nr:HlyD family efflux transporter periplasmic adaptor subunit [Brotonthovivens ammoniilytica]MCU6762182.1 biotin/lipoyl-binding protein [Brotonthovivens ammoniilytica]SCI58050.1 macrolide transporter subunit MacA [uncultured Roseburia sp.]
MKKVQFLTELKKISGRKKVLCVTGVALAGCVAAGSVFYVVYGKKISQNAGAGSIQEASAENGSISDTIVGTGNLENAEASAVKIPSGIVIEEVCVESGDTVSSGDVLARVDQVSVLNTLQSVQDEIESTDKKINSSKNDTDQETVKTNVSGRVKQIYAEEGDDAAACMEENGAVLLLSIDGKMAVKLQNVTDVSAGESVIVVLSDGSQTDGSIESVNTNSCIVTMTDNGVSADDEVTVKTEEGTELGSGNTYIHQQLAVTAASGTVDEIYVSENDKVSAGSALFHLSDKVSAEYQEQVAYREALTESMRSLVAMSREGTITADTDGIIESVNVSGDSESGDSDTVSTAQGMNMSADTQETLSGFTSLQVSAVQTVNEDTDNSESEDQKESDEEAEKIQFKIADSSNDGKTLIIEAPEKGGKPQTSVSGGSYYSGTISWNTSDRIFKGGTVYQADITLTANEGYYFSSDSISGVQKGLISGLSVSQDKKTLTLRLTFPETESDETTVIKDSAKTETSSESTQKENSTEKQNNASVASSDKTSDEAVGTSVNSTSSLLAETTESDGEASSEYSTDITAFTIASNENMAVSVDVDELDINSVSVDQEAEVTLDAIESETFTGTVTKVSSSASASGGVAKYSVEITIPRDDQMKTGMNASATIEIESRENVITIPVNALQERGDKVFVYTKKDSEGNLSGEQEVTTGLSDGETVEITDGLAEGDTVYYQKTGNTAESGGQGGPSNGMNGEMPGDFGEDRGGNMDSMPSGTPKQGGGQ